MARAGAFPGIAPRDTSALTYIKIGLGPAAFQIKPFKVRAGMSLMEAVAEIEALTNEQVVHVHLNDAPNRSLDDQQDFERLAPGEGIIDLAGFLGALKKIGYDGYLGVEIFSKELTALSNEDAAARAKAGYDAIMAKL